jgi:hypothetical protein
MGHDICPIGQHTLNTSNIELLAKELSDIFAVNVEYGYYDRSKFDPITVNDLSANENSWHKPY